MIVAPVTVNAQGSSGINDLECKFERNTGQVVCIRQITSSVSCFGWRDGRRLSRRWTFCWLSMTGIAKIETGIGRHKASHACWLREQTPGEDVGYVCPHQRARGGAPENARRGKLCHQPRLFLCTFQLSFSCRLFSLDKFQVRLLHFHKVQDKCSLLTK